MWVIIKILPFSHKIEVISKSTGEREKSLSVPPGGSGKLYGIVAVPESCPRGEFT